jgi:hypothetical protein
MICSLCGRYIGSACECYLPNKRVVCRTCNHRANDPVWQEIEKLKARVARQELRGRRRK